MRFFIPHKNLSSISFVCCAIAFHTLTFQFLNAAQGTQKQDEKEPTFSSEQLEFFESKVRPILVEKCYDCHGPDSDAEGGFQLGSRPLLLKGGETGAAIVPGDAKKSLLIDSINYGEVYEMPPSSKMPKEEIDILTQWVDMGAPWTGAEVITKSAKVFDLQARRKEHWCWQPIQAHQPPTVQQKDWPKDGIDNFILAKLEEAGLKPNGDTDRQTWIRRVYFDLIGLPPTPEQVVAFLKDQSPKAFENVVEELLQSPHFGEHWARHWMDLARYAETCGHEFDYPIPHAFQYRDYLVRAFNQDVKFDQFIKEHLAGDLLAQPRLHPTEKYNESVIGTGFLFFGESTHAPVDVRANEAGHIDNRIDVISKSFLGLTVACARCHDHKFDAISAKDYYAMFGFLKSSRRQLAMLDPKGHNEKIAQQIRAKRELGDKLLAELSQDFKKTPQDQLAKYLTVATDYLIQNPLGVLPSDKIFEGEELKVASKTGGTVTVQPLGDTNQHSWSGKKHIWWHAGKPGDIVEFQFTVPVQGDYQLSADFTKAADYGIIQILLDDKIVKKKLDLFNRRAIVKTGPIELVKNQLLKPGEHSLKLKIVGTNPKAVKKFMAGLDYLRLRPIKKETVADASQSIETIAKKNSLDASALKQWVQSLRKEAITQESSPLYPWYQAVLKDKKFNQSTIQKLIESAREKVSTSADPSNTKLPWMMTDFSRGDAKNWFTTGNSFEAQPTRSLTWDFRKGDTAVAPNSVMHSGLASTKLQGVIRSPSFTLSSKSIFYRIAGDKIRVRVIIDGYDMDIYNRLLFGGVSFDINGKQDFIWHRQSGDIARYKGHRAYIEIIDQGDGWVALDKIVLSDNNHPKVFSETLKNLGDASELDSKEDLASWYASEIKRNSELSAWAIENGLTTDDKVKTLASIRAEILELEKGIRPPMLAQAMTDGTPENEQIFVRGNHKTLGSEAPRALLEAFDNHQLSNAELEQSSGRLQLAEKMASAENPLTSRVITNRLWHFLTGRGIVASTDNFGVLGHKPTHPELLDYLATEFVKEKWSIKSMIRRIVLSRTYRMSSRPSELGSEKDPENLLLHRMRIRRLPGEAIRDSILTVSGRLDKKMFGPSVPIHLTSFMQGRGRPRRKGKLDEEGRRSLYIEVRRNFLHPMMLAFDTPIPFNAVGRRNVSNVPAQALFLMNDPFVIQQAEIWAKRLIAENSGDTDQMIEQMYQQAFSRSATKAEIANAKEFIEVQAVELKIKPSDAAKDLKVLRDLCHVLWNVKEFIYVN